MDKIIIPQGVFNLNDTWEPEISTPVFEKVAGDLNLKFPASLPDSLERAAKAYGGFAVEEEGTKHLLIIKGGEGSGHHEHRGRQGLRGGSQPGAGVPFQDKWHGPRTREPKRREITRKLRNEIERTWPRPSDIIRKPGEDRLEWEVRQDRADNARDMGYSAISDFRSGMRGDDTYLLVRREKGALVGIASMHVPRKAFDSWGDANFASIHYLATKEKGNGTVMMIKMALKAVGNKVGLTGGATHSALTFYTELAETLGVRDQLTVTGGNSMRIEAEALEIMTLPLQDIKGTDKEEALEFVANYIEEYDSEEAQAFFDRALLDDEE